MTLAACGSASTAASHTSTPSKYGWDNKVITASGTPELKLPYVGVATLSITHLASADFNFYKEVINPKDWVYSPIFHRHIFVGPYTKGLSETRIVNSKATAMAWREELTLLQNQQPSSAWPNVFDGFNYRTSNLQSWATDLTALSNALKAAIQKYHSFTTLTVPSENTIIASPVGPLTAKQMDNTSGQPQYTTIGTCVPHAFAIYNPHHTFAFPGLSGGMSAAEEYFADYGDTHILYPKYNNGHFSAGGGIQPTSNCASMS